MWVGDDGDGDDNGFGAWVMKVLGLEVGVGEGVEAVGLSGFVCCGSAGFVCCGSARFVWVGFLLDLFGLGFGWVCFQLCFWMRRMWWWLLVVGRGLLILLMRRKYYFKV